MWETPIVVAFISAFSGGIGAFVLKTTYERWREESGKRKRKSLYIQLLLEALYVARNVAKKLGATDEELGEIPEE